MPLPALRLLGPIECVTTATGDVIRLGRKPQALLALIAAHGSRGVTRDRAIGLLWGEQDEHSAGAAMRQCLHHLRRSLAGTGVTIDADRERIALAGTPTDAREFAELAVRDEVADLERAARLFRGEFAEGLPADDEAFAQWLRAERLRLRGLARDVVERLAGHQAGPQATAAAIELARRLLASDPVDERCHRALMQLLDRSGMRAEALRVYEQCRRTLRDELDVEPSSETVALAERLRGATTHGSGATAKQSPPGPTSGSSAAARVARREAHPAALDRMLRAWQLFSQFTAEANSQARVELESAIGIDPDCDAALALLGWTHFFDYIDAWTEDPEESYRRACVQAERAFALASDHPSTHQLKAKLLLWKEHYDEALRHARIAVELAPAYAYAHFNLADVLVHCGLHDEGLRHIRIALELDPVDYGMFRTIESQALLLKGDAQGALRSAESALTRNPDYVWSHRLLAAVHSQLGNFEMARAATRRAYDLNPRLRPRFDGAYTPLRLERDRACMADAYARIGGRDRDEKMTVNKVRTLPDRAHGELIARRRVE